MLWWSGGNERVVCGRDLHNDRVGYHLAYGIIGGNFEVYAVIKVATKSKADRAIHDTDGVNADYANLIYVC